MSIVTADVGKYVSSLSLEHLVVILLECESMSSRFVGNHPFDCVRFMLGVVDRPVAVNSWSRTDWSDIHIGQCLLTGWYTLPF